MLNNVNIDNHLDWFYAKFKGPDLPKWTKMRDDHKMLLTLIQTNNVKSILEIGTWAGYTGLLMWLFPGVEKVHSIDINKDLGAEFNCPTHFLREPEFYGHYYRDTNVTLEFCDTMKRVPREGESYDMVYIDANHDYVHTKNDTELGLKLAKKVIAWHDYGTEPEVVRYLNGIGNFRHDPNGLVAYRILS